MTTPEWVWPVESGNTSRLSELCEHPAWFTYGNAKYSPLGWAIVVGTDDTIRFLLAHCRIPRAAYHAGPSLPFAYTGHLEYAFDRGRYFVVELLMERNVPRAPGGGGIPERSPEYLRCLRNVRARKITLLIVGARKFGFALQRVPRDVVLLIARAVYATRNDLAWL